MNARLIALLACLALPAWPAAARAADVNRPLILGLVEPATSLAHLQKRLRATAQVRLSKLAELSPQQVSLTLHCKNQRQCDAAQARLAGATSWVRSVDVDAVRTRPTPAAASSARSL